MSDSRIDILMVTHDRPAYTRLSLQRLLDTCDDSMRVWLWHNGIHAETLEIATAFASHPRVHQFHHSPENQRLRVPTNWFWSKAQAEYLSKIDDDSLMPDGWAQTLRAAHEAEPRLGAIGCWSYLPADHRPELARKKLVTITGEHQLLQNCWVSGTGHMIKRRCIEDQGLMDEGQTFTNYCVHLAARGWLNGWYYPFVYLENMDDPRSPHSELRTEADFQARRGLTAQRFGVSSLEQLREQMRLHAVELQTCSTNPWHYIGWRGRLFRIFRQLSGGRS